MKKTADLFDNFNKFMTFTKDETDRSLALLVSAFMEESLGKLLIQYMMDVPSSKELVEGYNAPLGTFSSRTKAAHSLGLLMDQQCRDIDRIRKIRNEFAHNWELLSFEDPKVAGLVKAITPSRIQPPPKEASLHQHFNSSAAQLLIEIQVLTDQIRKKKLRLISRAVFIDTKPHPIPPSYEWIRGG